MMTMLCGAAGNFIQLFLARVGVGIGESASGPASHSLIADYFPPERRAGAMGVYGAAVPFGAFIALAGGGWIVENFDWRVAFFVAGIPGLLVGLIVWLTVKEPRGAVSLREAFEPQPDQLTFIAALKELWTQPTYWHLVAAGVLIQFVSYGIAAFYGSLYIRVFGIGYGELGLKQGWQIPWLTAGRSPLIAASFARAASISHQTPSNLTCLHQLHIVMKASPNSRVSGWASRLLCCCGVSRIRREVCCRQSPSASIVSTISRFIIGLSQRKLISPGKPVSLTWV